MFAAKSMFWGKLFSLLIGVSSFSLFANPSEIDELRQKWAIAKYETPAPHQLAEFEKLISRAESVSEKYLDSAPLALWHATVLSSHASLKGGMGGLSEAKKAKKLLEKSLALDSSAEQGLGHAVLGTLYARVPAWPVGFGDKDKARAHLKAAIAQNPKGIDSNYYYGQFLATEGQLLEARKHLEIAARAPIRERHEIADYARKKESEVSIQSLLKK